MLQAPANQNWSIPGIVVAGMVLMLVARLGLGACRRGGAGGG
jgi:hypothetical protein